MAGYETNKTVRYTGATTEAAQAAYVEDEAKAAAAGYRVERTWWETQQRHPTLVAEYAHAPSALAPVPAAPSPVASGRRSHRTRNVAIIVSVVMVLVGMALRGATDPEEERPAVASVASPSPLPSAPSSQATPSAAPDPTSTAIASLRPPPSPAAPAAGVGRGSRSISRSDPTGDLIDTHTEQRRGRPRYADITGFEASVDDDDLVVRFDVAGGIPASLDPLFTYVSYIVFVDVEDVGDFDYMIDIGSVDGWAVNVFDVAEGFNHRIGQPAIIEDVAMARVPLDRIGSSRRMSIRAVAEWTDYPNPQGDPFDSTTLQDRVPNNENRWLTLSTD